MKRLVIFVALACLSLAGCATSGPNFIVSVNGDPNERITYTASQTAAFKNALIAATKSIQTPDGMEMNFDIPESKWIPYIVRAQNVCDDARSNGWSMAESNFKQMLITDTLNGLQGQIESSDFTEGEIDALVEPFVAAQMNAIAAQGSYCPELAPEGVGKIPDNPLPSITTPVSGHKYYGEGCIAAGKALVDLLSFATKIDSGSFTLTDVSRGLLDVSAGLRVAAITEKNVVRSYTIESGVDPVGRLELAARTGSKVEQGSAIAKVSSVALEIIDACGL